MLGRPVRRAGRPGLIGTAARTAVVAGTATAVSGRVARRQAAPDTGPAPDTEPVGAPAAGPVEPAPGAAPAPEDDVIGKLERLAALRDQGVITEEEFGTAKARVLAG
ncbi:SHOCT domain-containing protein [Kitasatospora sp. NPDC091207]|uniref:SHOCT domain-containing protein n=1 Tax=Kitasatospora sp. NPDC091207 TaxID=3364083 RepID=UPI003817E540